MADTLPLKIAYLDDGLRLVFANEAFRRAYPIDDQDTDGMHVSYVFFASRYPGESLTWAIAGERTTFEDGEGEGDD